MKKKYLVKSPEGPGEVIVLAAIGVSEQTGVSPGLFYLTYGIVMCRKGPVVFPCVFFADYRPCKYSTLAYVTAEEAVLISDAATCLFLFQINSLIRV